MTNVESCGKKKHLCSSASSADKKKDFAIARKDAECGIFAVCKFFAARNDSFFIISRFVHF